MKLLYTDVRTPLTQVLTQEAVRLVEDGKRVFYIAPNSLSFEKEAKVLSYLEGQASFTITVTRFAQMARYFILNQVFEEKALDDIGLGMLFFKALSHMKEQDLKVYGALRKDSQFIQQLVQLYHELQTAQMDFTDLELLEEAEKREDLLAIFEAVSEMLVQHQYESQSKMAVFLNQVEEGHLEEQLKDVAIVVDGFTRFSAEEEALIGLLHRKGVEIVIGVYASEKAYRASFREGNLYQASVDFLLQLAKTFQVQPQYCGQAIEDSFSRMTRMLEARYDFSQVEDELGDQDRTAIQLWQTNTQKEELEYVAKSIRQRLHDGARYRDIRVLLGDVEAYQLQLKTIFDQYQIPFYLGRSEAMVHHPLIQVIESLWRIKQFNYQTEDVINLLKTSLYSDLTQEEVDAFEQYLRFAEVKGAAKFHKPFTSNRQGKFNLEGLNTLRERVAESLAPFFSQRKQKVTHLLMAFTEFLQEAQLSQNLQALIKDLALEEQERYDQVWKAFLHVLEELNLVFEDQELTVDDFLALLLSGMQLSQYRTVPATVDVVMVQSYDLIEPLTAPYVYAIGLTQERFPKIAQNTSLLSEEERQQLNEATQEGAELQVVTSENLKKNRFVAVSLLNAATKQLVLSAPSLVNETEDSVSPYLVELAKEPIAIEWKTKQAQASSDDIGTYRALLARVIELHQEEITSELSAEEASFWGVAVRVLRKKLQAEGIQIPQISTELKSRQLQSDTLQALYPEGKSLTLSASALNEYYKHQYAFYLRYVLGLQEDETIRPDARSHGNFLHRIFEKVLKDRSDQAFDQRLSEAIRETSQEAEFQQLYGENGETEFIRNLLLDTAKTTGRVLAQQNGIETIGEETLFGGSAHTSYPLSDGRLLQLRGKVDRIDQLREQGTLGVVDYKSSLTQFHYDKFFNGLNSQLPTYLSAIQDLKEYQAEQGIFGAMYLEMGDPLVDLKKTKTVEDAINQTMKSQQYKGLFMADQAPYLGEAYDKNKAMMLSKEELDLLLLYNAYLYKTAAEGILKGQFAINPYSENGRNIAPYVEQFKSITGFEADRHLGQARFLTKLDQKGIRGEKVKAAWIEKMKEVLNK